MPVGGSLLDKLKKLIRTAGILTINFEDQFVAIKMHFGEPGNMAFLRPNYAKAVVDVVKELGGKPFLTDSNTLYVGGRKNALDHLDSAYGNGFLPSVTGAQVLIADGLKGTDDVAVPVENGEYIKEAKIGRAVMDADVFISLTHFKGHECTGFGGALKNIGMGCGSRAGKMEMHSAGKPFVDQDLCIGCGRCARNCAHSAPIVRDGKCTIDHEKCVGCGSCIGICPKDAIQPAQDEANDILNCKIAEYSKAVLQGRPNFHISMVMNVSPYCDCYGGNDAAIVPDVGMFASFDPVALDMACADAVNAQPVIQNSLLGEAVEKHEHEDRDYFGRVSPDTDWQSCISHAVKIGLGTDKYELIQV